MKKELRRSSFSTLVMWIPLMKDRVDFSVDCCFLSHSCLLICLINGRLAFCRGSKLLVVYTLIKFANKTSIEHFLALVRVALHWNLYNYFFFKLCYSNFWILKLKLRHFVSKLKLSIDDCDCRYTNKSELKIFLSSA